MRNPNHAQSIRTRLLNMSSGDNRTFQQMVVRYFHERLLYRLSVSRFRERFILKGGALLYAFDEIVPRPTLDIDFLGSHIDNDKGVILSAFKEVAEVSCPEDGICFLPESMTAEDITVEKKYPGVRISLIGLLGTYRQKLSLDIGFGDVTVPYPVELDYPVIFNSMDEPKIIAYSLETVIAEKFQTIIERGVFNSRMKDFYDLYRILKTGTYNSEELAKAVAATFANRNTEYIDNHICFQTEFGEQPVLAQLWNNYAKKMKVDLPPFDEVTRFIMTKLQPYWEKLKK